MARAWRISYRNISMCIGGSINTMAAVYVWPMASGVLLAWRRNDIIEAA